MGRITRRQTLLATGALAIAASTRARAAEPSLQALLEARLKGGGVALAAGRLAGGQAEFGGAAVSGARPDADSVFEIGSITKTFTALLLADAVVRGEIKLDDPVEAALPDGLRLRDSQGQPLRWVDLATQRSGLPRLAANMAPANPADPYADYDWPALRLFLQGWRPKVARDSRFEYSNLGFGLLGHALALREDTDYATLLARRVLQPLGLTGQVGFALPDLLPGHDGKGRPVPAWHFRSVTAGAGALHGTARGLLRYADAALGGYEHPLREAFALCLQRRAATIAPTNPIGLAWLLAPLNDRTVFTHDGATFGFASSLWLDPERRRASVVLANAQVAVDDLALRVLGDASVRDVAAIAATHEQLQPLEGVYALNPQFKLSVRADGTQLLARATGQGEFELFAKSPRRFFAKITPLEIQFDDDTKALTLFQGGATLRFVRE
ncbi:serine hydrolase [Roseateles sp.]|uniref:serine hydrolase domain-containing protein n=1 Tax=Roseateles sp. TaxID=1971397 RepID=UPI0025D62BAD|nr:serine hydrolase domain-containing protein [Roseateles sp.]MBV8035740.1 beta-lactamase family protein [Roseateles sp.]